MEAFIKAQNLPMVHTVAARQNLDEDNLRKLNISLVEILRNSNRFEEAATLIDPSSDFELALDCYLRCNNFDKAIKLCVETKHVIKINTTVKSSLMIACDLK